MLEFISCVWDVNNRPPQNVEAIALISYAARGDGSLTNGSHFTTHFAIEAMKTYSNARLYWGVYSENEMSANIEFTNKNTTFNKLFPGRHEFVGRVSSSTEECRAILANCSGEKSFLVFAEGWHSRRCQIVWRHFFSGTLFFRSFQGDVCADRDNPMWFQRYSFVWMLFNFAFTPLYKFYPGVEWFAKRNFHQPSR